MSVNFTRIGVLKGHNGRVTAIATPAETSSMIVTASRDKTLIKWDVSLESRMGESAGRPVKSLVGHSDFVQDVQTTPDGAYALSGSWDNTLGLWDLATGTRAQTFKGHENDVLSVAFSPNSRQIISGARDRTIKVWNTLGSVKYTFDSQKDGHKDWVSCVRFAPSGDTPTFFSGSSDGSVKMWVFDGASWKLNHTFPTEHGYITSVCVSPDGSLCAAGGKHGTATLYDTNELRELYDFGSAGEPVNALIFSPIRYWITVASGSKITIYSLEDQAVVAELRPFTSEGTEIKTEATALAWSPDGTLLYVGFDDGLVRVWEVSDVVPTQ